MKHFAALTLFCLAFSFTSRSQNKPAIHFNIGGSGPMGKFNSKDPNDTASGLALVGLQAELGYSHPFPKSNWGWTANLRGRINAVDQGSNLTIFRQLFPVYQWSSAPGRWKAASAMVGVYIMPPVTSRLSLRAEITAGAAQCYLPDYSITGVFDTAHTGATAFIYAKVDKKSAVSFSAAAKASLIYHLNDRLQLSLNFDYWYLNPTFKQVTQTVYVVSDLIVPGVISLSNAASPPQVAADTRDYKQNMSTLGITAGIAVSF